MASPKETPMQTPSFLEEENIHVELTPEPLSVTQIMNRVKSPKAGAVVLFAGIHCQPPFFRLHALIPSKGTTRDSFDGRPVKELQYSAYAPLALRTMLMIAQSIKANYRLTAISIVHRLGVVPIGEESILIALSSPHRQAAWKAGEEALEECKAKVEVWKLEEFGGEQGGVWRANRNGVPGMPVSRES